MWDALGGCIQGTPAVPDPRVSEGSLALYDLLDDKRQDITSTFFSV